MDPDSARAFIASNHRAVLSTTRVDGRPSMTPVAATVDDHGKVVVSTTGGSAKVRNLRRTPFASILVMNDGFYGAWCSVEGAVEIVDLPAAMEGLVAYYRSVGGEHPDWDDYRRAMEEEGRVLLRLTIERAGPGGN